MFVAGISLNPIPTVDTTDCADRPGFIVLENNFLDSYYVQLSERFYIGMSFSEHVEQNGNNNNNNNA